MAGRMGGAPTLVESIRVLIANLIIRFTRLMLLDS